MTQHLTPVTRDKLVIGKRYESYAHSVIEFVRFDGQGYWFKHVSGPNVYIEQNGLIGFLNLPVLQTLPTDHPDYR